MNAIILKEPLVEKEVLICSHKHHGRIAGAEWRSSYDTENTICIEILEILGNTHNLKSDIAESKYQYFEDKNNQVYAIHIQTTLTEELRKLKKSKWQRSQHILNSLYETNRYFKQKVETGSILGISIKNIIRQFEKFTDSVSLD